MKVYIAGPMSGYAEFNFPAFAAEAARLRALGHDVVSPHEVDTGGSTDWHVCMKLDIKVLVDCEAIICLDGWENSRGAKVEVGLARSLEIPVYAPLEIC